VLEREEVIFGEVEDLSEEEDERVIELEEEGERVGELLGDFLSEGLEREVGVVKSFVEVGLKDIVTEEENEGAEGDRESHRE